MAAATKFRSGFAFAQFRQQWSKLPAFRALSGNAVKLLLCMMVEYRPGQNGQLQWSDLRAGEAIGMSEASGARALDDLLEKRWIDIHRQGRFQRDKPTTYALAMFPNDDTGEPATMGFEHWPT